VILLSIKVVCIVIGITLTENFKVDEEQYERWEEFLDGSVGVESFSHLVRVALSASASTTRELA